MAYNLISTVSVGAGGAATIDFTSIPQGFVDLLVVLSGRSTVTGTLGYVSVKMNGSTTGYTRQTLYGDGSTANADNSTTNPLLDIGTVPGASATANTFDNLAFYIPNYAGSANKAVSMDSVSENNATATRLDIIAGLWANTAAITSLSILFNGSGTFAQYSTASLYGIN